MILEDTDVEIWRDIKGFEGLYAVSNKGNVKNLKSGRILGGAYNQYGYKRITLKGKKYLIHRLVALAFIPNPYNLPEVNHKNEIKDDNNVDNLEWVSTSYNVSYSIHNQSYKIKQLDKCGNLIKIWDSIKQIGRETDYHQGNIINCCKGKRHSAYGYCWQYANPESQRVINRPIAVLTKDGEFVVEYRSAAEASRGLKIKKYCIYRCLKGLYKSTHGLKFIYID